MPAVTRLGDYSTGDPCGAPPRPSSEGSGDVYANGIPVHRENDAWEPHACPGSSPHGATLLAGSGTVFANGKQLGRIGDPISCGSTVDTGSGDVFAGG